MLKRYILVYNVLLLSAIFSCKDTKKPEGAEDKILAATADSLVKEARNIEIKDRISSRTLADSALQMALAIGNKAIDAKCYNQFGRLFLAGRQLDSALQYHRRALEIRRKLLDRQAMGYSYANIGVVMSGYGLWERGDIYNDSAIWAFQQAKDTFQYIRRLQAKGKNAIAREGNRAALNIFLDYEQRSRAFGNDALTAEACHSLGRCYYALHQTDSSIYWLSRSLDLYNRIKDSTVLLNLKIDLALRYFRIPDMDRGNQLIDEAEQLLRNGFASALDSLSLLEAQFIQKLARAGQDSLIPHFEDCFVAEEDYYLGIQASQLSEFEAAYQLKAKKDQNKELFMQNQRYRIRFMGVLLLFLALLVILVVTVNYYRGRRNMNIREMELKERHIRNILQEQELKTINAALEGKDQERARIAGELHDRLGYILALAKLNFSSLQEDLSRLKDQNAECFHRISEILDEASTEVRRISHDLYGGSVFNFGITTALYQLAEAVSAANKIKVNFHSQYVSSDIRLDLQVSVYRIVGELISNTLKHGKAGQIDIQLFGRADELVLSYEDNGKGFDANDATWKYGIGYTNIKARLKKYNGTYLVEFAPGRGMYFQAEIPLYLATETKETQQIITTPYVETAVFPKNSSE